MDEQEVQGADEQLGSPLVTFEVGWLLGLILGLVTVIMIGRRRKRGSQKSLDHRAGDCEV